MIGGFNKSGLIELLRKHPDWNEDTLSIIFDVSAKREIEPYDVRAKRNKLLALSIEGMSEERKHKYENSLYLLAGTYAQYLPDGFDAGYLDSLSGVKCSPGQKTSRVINKVCQQFGVTAEAEFNARFAELADTLNPIDISRVASLSVHPCDYLEMSNTSNSWSSCHNLHDGCYRAGTLSYLLDGTSMIFSTVEKDWTPPLYEAPKVTREVFCYSSGILLQSRLYPNFTDIKTAGVYRNLVQAAIALCKDAPNLWTLKTDIGTIEEYVDTCPDSSHYTDYLYADYNPTLSLLKSEDTSGPSITVGEEARCINCYSLLEEDDTLWCCDCEDGYTCAGCGRAISSENAYRVGDNVYCCDCVYYCEQCDEYVLNELTPVYNARGGITYVCEDCYEDCVGECEECGDNYLSQCLTERNGRYLCPTCLEAAEADEAVSA